MLWIAYKDAYLSWLSLHGGEKHLAKAREVLGRFTRLVDPIHLEEITQTKYACYLAERKKRHLEKRGRPLSPATLNGDVRYLNQCFAVAGPRTRTREDRNNLGVADPDWLPPHIDLLTELQVRPKTVAQEVFGRAFAACDHATEPRFAGCSPTQWWRTFFVVAYWTGLRCEEQLSVPRPTEEELQESVLRVPAEVDKAGREAYLFLQIEAVAAIRKMPEFSDGLLFSWPFKKTAFYNQLHRFQSKAGMPRCDHVLPHALRRTKATELVKAGCSLPLVQREMRHSTPAVTAKHYIGQICAEQKKANQALPLPDEVRRLLKEDRQLCLFQ